MRGPVRCSPKPSWTAGAGLLVAALLGAPGAAAQLFEMEPMPGCLVAQTSASASGTPSSRIREYPGVQCVMNVGLVHPDDYEYKVPNCDGLTARRDALAGNGIECDTISLIELNSDQQCRCACGPSDTAEQQACAEDGWLPDSARCQACRGCGAGGEPSCQEQAEVICPSDDYEVRCYDGSPANGGNGQTKPIGCDCTCWRKDECSLHGAGCTTEQFRPFDRRCTPNNSAQCVFCPNAPDGPSMATCTMHPDHCAGYEDIGFESYDDCFYACNTALVQLVVHKVQGYDIKTLVGDWNCSATASCEDAIQEILPPLLDPFVPLANPPIRCPYLEDLAAAGLRVCEHAPFLFPGCSLDFAVSNWCGCGPGVAAYQHFGLRDGRMNDHPLAVFGTHRAYQLYDMPIVEAHSQRSCGGTMSTSSTSDHLGASCDVFGWQPSWCEGEGATSRGLLMYKRPNECPQLYEQFGYPRVLACDRAAATATAACTPLDSAGTFVRQKTGDAEVTASAACSGGCGETVTPEPDIAAEQDRALPLLVAGEPSLVVSRVWERELGPTECTNTWPPLCVLPGWQPPVCEAGGGGGGSGSGGGNGGEGGGSGGGSSEGGSAGPRLGGLPPSGGN